MKPQRWSQQGEPWKRDLLGPINSLTTQHSAASQLCSRETAQQQLGTAWRRGERSRTGSGPQQSQAFLQDTFWQGTRHTASKKSQQLHPHGRDITLNIDCGRSCTFPDAPRVEVTV